MILLIAPLIGVASALLTLLLTPTLQHYFWTRQRYAERQLAIIEELNMLAAELHFFLLTSADLGRDNRERFSAMLHKTSVDVRVLFSPRACDWFQPLFRVISEVLGLVKPDKPAPHDQLASQLFKAHANAIAALYWDIGLPPISPATDGWVSFLFTERRLPPIKNRRDQ